jgi:hypothetical protein
MPIITEKHVYRSYLYIIVLGLLLVVSLFLRLYHVADYTEFLADQGSAAVMIYDAWVNKSLPLIGQAFSTGQLSGPAYLFLIAPSLILTDFNPLAPAVFLAILSILTIFLIYKIYRYFLDIPLSLALAMLYAFSPIIITQNRNNWNPTIIPLCITIIIFAICKIWFEKKFEWIYVMGFVSGVAVQLHVTNYFTCLMELVFWVSMYFNHQKLLTRKQWIWYSIAGLGMFLLPLSTYIYYEVNNQYINTISFLKTILGNRSNLLQTDKTVGIFDYISRLVVFIVPELPKFPAAILGLVLIVSNFYRISSARLLFTVWFIGGLVILFIFHMPIYDHYLQFLSVIPIFMLGLSINVIRNRMILSGITFLVIIIALVNLFSNNFIKRGHQDIARTKALTEEMIYQSHGQPFSFTLSVSRSFSDYHYRFFFRLKNINPDLITNKKYTKLFIICEEGDCPSRELQSTYGSVQASCWDHHCRIDYPRISFNEWHITDVKDIEHARLYTYQR